MNPMKHRVSAECSRVIRSILKIDPRERPSIEEVLHSEYVTQMSRKFNWDLKKLLRFRKIKQAGLQSSMISGLSYATQNTSQSDSFYFDKRMSGMTSFLETKGNSTEKSRIMSSLSSQKPNNGDRPVTGNTVMSTDGAVLNFEKKQAESNQNVFLKELSSKRGEPHGRETKDQYTIKESGAFETLSEKLINDPNLNVFSRTGSEDPPSHKLSQNTSQIQGNERGSTEMPTWTGFGARMLREGA